MRLSTAIFLSIVFSILQFSYGQDEPAPILDPGTIEIKLATPAETIHVSKLRTVLKDFQNAQASAAKGDLPPEKLDAVTAQATDAASQVVAENPESSYVLSQAAGVLQQAAFGGPKPAPNDAERRKVIEEDQATARAYVDKAIDLAREQKNPEALILAYYTRGYGSYLAHDYPEANADGARVLKLDPKNKLGRALYELTLHAARLPGPPLDAKAAPDQSDLPSDARAQGSSSPAPVLSAREKSEGYVERALKSLRTGNVEGALRTASLALLFNPGNPRALAVRAGISNKRRNYAAAIIDAEKALAVEPGNAEALLAMAEAQFTLGQYDAALKAAEAVLKLGSKNPGQEALAHFYLGQIYALRGDKDKAASELGLAVALDPALKALIPAPMAGLLAGPSPASASWGALLSGPRGGGLGAAAALLLGLTLFGLFSLLRRKEAEPAPRARPYRQWDLDSEEPAGPVPEALPAAAKREAAARRDGTIAAGTVLGGQYRIARELGRGGMGVVYLAEDMTLQRQVAIKQVVRSAGDRLADVLKEARLVAQLKHANIGEIFTAVEEAGEVYLVFEYIAGDALDEVLAAHPRLALEKARAILAQAALAVDYAHGRKIIHRDLKPANIMIAKDGTVKVMDFGIAHQSRGGKESTQTSASGTPIYMAPEQAFGTVSPASDTYSLGVIAYEMLAGRRPYDGDDFQEKRTKKEFPPVSSGRPDLPAGLDAFFARALEPDAAKRYPNVGEFMKAFGEAAGLGGGRS